VRNRYVLLADATAFMAAVCAAFGLRFDWYFFHSRPEFLPYVIASPIVKIAVLYLFGMYGRFWRYATVDDMVALMLAGSAASVAMAAYVSAGIFWFGFIYEFSRSVFVADWILSLCAIGAVRLSVRVIGESQSRERQMHGPGRRVLIAGAGDAGAIVAREIQRNPGLKMDPIGFIDDDPVKIGKKIYGVPVRGAVSQLATLAESLAIDEVLIAMPTASGTVLRGIAETCRRMNVVSRTMPGMFELLDGNVSVSRLRQVDITDLLRRSPIADGPDASSIVAGRTVLVTGAGGSIGFELCRQIAHGRPRSLVLLGHGENSIFEAKVSLKESFPSIHVESVIADIRDRDRMFRVFDRVRPDIVFHAAAHKHVPLMEENPEVAISNNVVGTQNVIDAAVRAGSGRLVLISSDKAVSPSSLMGASKRVAERLVQAAARATGRPFVVVRFGNVLGSRGSVVPTFKKQIESGGPIYVTHPDMRRFFMTIPEAVHLVLHAGAMGTGGELFVLKMGEPLRVVELAQDLIRLSGLSPEDIPIVYTGLRPGEKLEEALWETGAEIAPTAHPEVLQVSEEKVVDDLQCSLLVASMQRAAQRGDGKLIDSMLSEFIPTFSRPGPSGSDPTVVIH
jgi:FlaA1/EpsC-like NDP-sugar epimerase